MSVPLGGGSIPTRHRLPSRSLQEGVQFLHADFAAGSEVSGKISSRVIKIDVLFTFVLVFSETAVYYPVTSRLSLLSTESHRRETGREKLLRLGNI